MRKVGAALLEAIKREGATLGPAHMRGLAISDNDVEILSYLSNRPCSIASHISVGIGLSRGSVDWHLRKMVKSDVLSSRRFKGREGYFPVGMLREDELGTFAILASREPRMVMADVLTNPGDSQTVVSARLEISRQSMSRIMGELARIGLVVASRDGRNRRYYPTDLLATSGEAYIERRKGLLDGTIAKLATLGLRPRTIKSSALEAHILLGEKGRQKTLRFGLNPYVSAIRF